MDIEPEEACHALARLPIAPDPGADQEDQPGLPHLPLRGLHAPLQRAHRHTFDDLSVPTDSIFLVLRRLRSPLRLHHLAEMFLERGFVFCHETHPHAGTAWVAPAADRAAAGRAEGQGRPEMARG